MQINRVIVPSDIAQKLTSKHSVEDWEAEEVFFNPDSDLLVRKSRGRYVAYGRTFAGRYLFVGFKLRRGGIAEIRTARDMTPSERRYYGRR
jgi:uncharacterized protein